MKKRIRNYLILFITISIALTLFLPAPAYANQRQAVEAFVGRFYQQCLNRAPDAAGLNNWTDALLSGRASGAEVAAGFVMSAELNSRNLNDTQFLEIMYRAFFDRAPDAAGMNGWLANMRNGMSRQAVLAGFINSAEFSNLCSRYGIRAGSLSVSGSVQSAPPAQTERPQAASLGAYERRVLELINHERAAHGLGPLSADASLGGIAVQRSADMVARNYFSHSIPGGGNVFGLLRAAGISYSIAGENLAHSRPASAGSPEAFVRAWMASPGHRANILRAQYNRIGIGTAHDGNARRVVTTVFSN